MKRALITGVSGQDGSYLAELLLGKGYEVHGIVRRESLEDSVHKLSNIEHIRDRLVLHAGAVSDNLQIYKIFSHVLPDECYHLAASSFVNYSFDDEHLIMNSNFTATHFILSTIAEIKRDCRLFFAGSSEMFGEPDEYPQNENTRFNPKSIYGISKVASHYLVKNYRERDGVFACSGIMFNHESPRRGYQFVTRKITSTVAKIALGLADSLSLGNLDVRRDWGYSPDYVKAMWMMLQFDNPQDYVIGTGILHSVRDFLHMAFSHVGLNYEEYVRTDPRFFRPSEKYPLVADSQRIRAILGWKPEKPLEDVVKEMVDSDLRVLKYISDSKAH